MWVPTFHRNVLSPYSELRVAKNGGIMTSVAPPKCRYLPTGSHEVTTDNTNIDEIILITSNQIHNTLGPGIADE